MAEFRAKKILIADDHPLFREALQQAIQNNFGPLEIVCCGSFAALQKILITDNQFDLIMLDLHMPGAVGFSTLHYLTISYPQIPVVMISANEDTDVVSRALIYGCNGFIPKSASIDCIVQAISEILAGEIWVPESYKTEQAGSDAEDEDFVLRLSTLTPKQFRVLMMLVEGRTNNEIADESYVTIATVKAHLSEIFKKLKVSNRTQAALLATSHLQIEDPNTL